MNWLLKGIATQIKLVLVEGDRSFDSPGDAKEIATKLCETIGINGNYIDANANTKTPLKH